MFTRPLPPRSHRSVTPRHASARLRRLLAGAAFAGAAVLGGCDEGPTDSTATIAPAPAPESAPTAPPTATPPLAPAGSPPAITMTRLVHDFGVIPDIQPRRTSFSFTNTGGSELVIADVKAGCGCTVPVLSKRRYQPGETGTIDVQFDPKGKSGTDPKSIKVVANTAPEVTELTLEADVRPMVRYDRFFRIGQRTLGKTHRAVASLRHLDPDLAIERITISDPNITARVVSDSVVDSEEDGQTMYRTDLELTLSDQMPWGTLYAKTVDIDVYGRWSMQADPINYTYRMYLTGSLYGELESSPGVASIGRVNRGQDYTKTIKVERIDGGELEILSARVAEATMPGMQVRLERSSSGRYYNVVLFGNAGSHLGAVRGLIVLETPIPGEEQITIPISGGVV